MTFHIRVCVAKPAQEAKDTLASANQNSALSQYPPPQLTSREFDYMVYELSDKEASIAHAYIVRF